MTQTGQIATKKTNGNGRGHALLPHSPLFFNRELSWLDFNARVLEEANNPAHPLLERLKFLAIFSSNLDEFFMIHIPGMQERADEETGIMPSERAEIEKLRAIQLKLQPMLADQFRCFEELLPQLARYGIRIHRHEDLPEDEKARLRHYFAQEDPHGGEFG